MKQYIKEILSGYRNRLSSKRVCGVLGWLVLMGVYIYSTIANTQLPEATEYITWAIVTLLGVDAVANAFKKNKNNEEN